MGTNNSTTIGPRLSGCLLVVLTACGPLDDSDELYDLALAGKGDSKSLISVLRHHPIQIYGQSQQPWRGDRLFRMPGCNPMSMSGCAITTYAMLNSYFADWSQPDRPRSPADINNCLGASGYREGCKMIAGGCMEPSMMALGWTNGYLRTLSSEIDQGYPVIARVRLKDREECHHSVLVIGYESPGTSRWSFLIYDPTGQGTVRRLSHYQQVCYTLRFRGKIHNDLLH